MKKMILISTFYFVLFFIPFEVLAQGPGDHTSDKVTNYWNYGFIASLIILIIFLVLFALAKRKMKNISLKKKENRKKHHSIAKRSTIYKWISILFSVATIFLLIMANASMEQKITFEHFHGVGYTDDGEELYVASHDGLRVYKDDAWTMPTEGENHDYMGFSMFKGGFYSSGHPAPDSDLENPLGIVKSTDNGKTLEKLDLYGSVDFHGMTVGYETEELYVFNPAENARMDQPGFYYSTNMTETWNKSEFRGLEGQAIALAAHSTKEGMVAVGTDKGIFISDDYGNNFEGLAISEVVSAVSFDHQNSLLVATQSSGGTLSRIDLSTKEVNELNTPDLEDDVIAYVKQNPANKEELVIATNNKNIYFSFDGGNTWEQSVDNGVAITR